MATQRGATDAITESVELSPSEAAFDKERRIAIELLGLDPDTPTVTGHSFDRELEGLFLQLMALEDEAVLGILAVVMGETLEPGSTLIELLGRELDIAMASVWQADGGLLDLIRDKVEGGGDLNKAIENRQKEAELGDEDDD